MVGAVWVFFVSADKHVLLAVREYQGVVEAWTSVVWSMPHFYSGGGAVESGGFI